MSKMGNKQSGGFDSKREHRRYQDLALLEKIGEIQNLRHQVAIELLPKQVGERACKWIADFVYTENGEEIWEDCKGFRTEVYRIKRKLVLHRYGKKIRET